MQCFKVGEKSYYIALERTECVITEFGNEENQYVFTLAELKELDNELNNFHLFSAKGIVTNAATDVSVNGLDEDGVCIKIQTSVQQMASYIQVPLVDFCKDLMEIYHSKDIEASLGTTMPSVKAAYEKWKKRSNFLFLDGPFVLLDTLNQTVGAGYFDDVTLKVLDKSNLSLFESLKLYFEDGNFVTISLQVINKERNQLSTYQPFLVAMNEAKSPEKLKPELKNKLELLPNFNFNDPREFDLIYKAMDIQEIGKAKSTLDNFFSL